MKKLFIILAAIVLFSCTKENAGLKIEEVQSKRAELTVNTPDPVGSATLSSHFVSGHVSLDYSYTLPAGYTLNTFQICRSDNPNNKKAWTAVYTAFYYNPPPTSGTIVDNANLSSGTYTYVLRIVTQMGECGAYAETTITL